MTELNPDALPTGEQLQQMSVDTPEGRASANVKMAAANPSAVPQKFKLADGSINTEALLQSYLHMERLASGKEADPAATAAAAAVATETAAAEKDAATASDANSLSEALEGPPVPEGTDLWMLAKEQLVASGEVSDAVVAALTKQGVPPEALAAMGAGIKARQKSDMDQAYEITGGKDQFDGTMAWAKTNLDAAEKASIAEALKGPSALLVLQGLHARATAAGPHPSGQVNTAQGGMTVLPASATANLKPFESVAAQQAAMRDERYSRDADYRDTVDMRIMIGAGAKAEDLRKV